MGDFGAQAGARPMGGGFMAPLPTGRRGAGTSSYGGVSLPPLPTGKGAPGTGAPPPGAGSSGSAPAHTSWEEYAKGEGVDPDTPMPTREEIAEVHEMGESSDPRLQALINKRREWQKVSVVRNKFQQGEESGQFTADETGISDQKEHGKSTWNSWNNEWGKMQGTPEGQSFQQSPDYKEYVAKFKHPLLAFNNWKGVNAMVKNARSAGNEKASSDWRRLEDGTITDVVGSGANQRTVYMDKYGREIRGGGSAGAASSSSSAGGPPGPPTAQSPAARSAAATSPTAPAGPSQEARGYSFSGVPSGAQAASAPSSGADQPPVRVDIPTGGGQAGTPSSAPTPGMQGPADTGKLEDLVGQLQGQMGAPPSGGGLHAAASQMGQGYGVENPAYSAYSPTGYSPAQLDYLKQITQLANFLQGEGGNLYGTSMPAFSQAIGYYQNLLGAGGKAGLQQAIAPQQEMVGEQARGAESNIRNNLRGGSRDQALAELARSRFNATAGMGMAAKSGAAAALLQGGAQGLGLSQGATGQALNAQGMGLSNVTATDQFQAGLSESSKQAGAQLGLGYAGLNLQGYLGKMANQLGYAQLAQNQSQFESSMSMSKEQFEKTFGLSKDQFELQQRQIQQQQQAEKGRQIAQLIGGGVGMIGMGCCFIFLEAYDGDLPPEVRRYRDEHLTPRNRRGYYKLAEVLVPLMRKYPVARHLVRLLMTAPLASYARWHYGVEGAWAGRLFSPIKAFWLGLFDYLGDDHPFRRENGEVI